MAILFDGVVFGLQLALLALGLTLVYGLGGVLNLAHGQFVAVAAIVAASVLRAGGPVLPAALAGITAAGLLALAVDRTLMRPVYRLQGQSRVLRSLLLTLGVAFAVDGVLVTFHPSTRLGIPMTTASLEVFGVTMRSAGLLASATAATVLAGAILALRHTRTGQAVRAVIDDEQGAELCGIDPSRIRTLVFVLSGLTAGIVAVTQGMVASVGATSGFDLTILALVVTVVGGLGRISGTLLAGVLLGIVHALVSYHIGAFVTVVALLLVAIVVIVLRPSGILGEPPR